MFTFDRYFGQYLIDIFKNSMCQALLIVLSISICLSYHFWLFGQLLVIWPFCLVGWTVKVIVVDGSSWHVDCYLTLTAVASAMLDSSCSRGLNHFEFMPVMNSRSILIPLCSRPLVHIARRKNSFRRQRLIRCMQKTLQLPHQLLAGSSLVSRTLSSSLCLLNVCRVRM
jgi:hypothetical protein